MRSPAVVPTTLRWACAVAQEIPVSHGTVRFAIGDPSGVTSNSWWLATGPRGDVYLGCRDNYRDAKVSLHASGRWRMAFTEKAIEGQPQLLPSGGDRAWYVWDRPPETLPATVLAFRLYFLPSELAVTANLRVPDMWRKVVFIEPAPPGCVTVTTLFVTRGTPRLNCEGGPTLTLAVLPLDEGRCVQLTVHVEAASAAMCENVAESVRRIVRAAEEAHLSAPAGRG